jgi:exopolysaccharide biosynthesis predicted pyruvyltransferase EpsI
MTYAVNQFDQINTNRLHVSITGALLGKTVNLYDNSYGKLFNVYD